MNKKEQKIVLSNQAQDTPLEHDGQAVMHIQTHFVLSIVAICASCFMGFFAVPLAIASLIFSLRTQDHLMQEKWELAKQTSFWAGLFGWITVAILIIPILLIILFGGALLGAFGAFLHAL